MLQITTEFKNRIVDAMLIDRDNFEGTDGQFAIRWAMPATIWSKIKSGERVHILKDEKWLQIARKLEINPTSRKWVAVRTDVFNMIEEDVLFCKENSKSMIFVDKNEIGKTFTARYLSRTLKNCFYVDGSQCDTKAVFVRTLAKTLGLDNVGTLHDVEENIVYYLRLIENPVVIVDDPGDMNYSAFLSIKKFWNGTESICGWYLIGDEAMREKWNRGMKSQRAGFKAIFSRFSSSFGHIVPYAKEDRFNFYHTLVEAVLVANMSDKSKLGSIVNKCITEDEFGNIGGLRRAESLLILNS
jgi:hypothetical protein